MNPLQDIINTTMDNIQAIADVNTIIGDPITASDGTVIIPVSKMSFGVGAGGSDISKKDNSSGFAGGSGAGATVTPVAFLVINGQNVRLIPMSDSSTPINKIVDLVPEMVDKVSGFFASKKKDQEPSA